MNKENFLSDFKEKNTPVEILGDIVDWNIKVECRCLLCNEIFYITPSNLKRGSIHSKCSYIKRGENRKISHNEFIIKLHKVNKNITVVGKYEKAQKPLDVKCNICNHTWSITPNNLLSGHGCPMCHFNKLKKDLDKHCQEIMLKFPSIIILDSPQDVYQEINCQCKKCNKIWTTTLNKLKNYKTSECCPICSGKTVNVELLHNVINKNNISIEKYSERWSEKIKCTCNICGHTWKSTNTDLLNGKACSVCTNKTKKTHEQFMQEVNSLNPNVEILSQYINAKTKIKRKCTICGDISFMLPKGILGGICKGCASQKMHSLFSKSSEDYEKDFINKYKNYSLIDKYINAHTKIKIIHNKCQKSFMFHPSRIYDKTNHICPYCYPKNSNGEREIQNYLDKNNIIYIPHKTFFDLKGVNDGFLSYDFYLPDFNILIEFQGIQHYQAVDGMGGEDRFIIQKEHDKRKYNYAKENDIKLIEIPYWDFDSIDDILLRELS